MNSGFTHEAPVKGATNIWLTPPEIIRQLGEFDLDPCFLPEDIRPWNTAHHHFTEETDGLKQDWFGRVWLNPPYGQETTKWLEKMALHGCGTSLIYARTETRWFHDYIWDAADAVFFPKGRIQFKLPNGMDYKGSPGTGSCLVAYGPKDADKLFEYSLNNKGKYLDINLN